MFSGSRCCLRPKLNHRLLVAETLPTQALLFLCPQWFSTQHRIHTNPQAHEPSHTITADSAYKLSDPCREARSQPVGPLQFRDVSRQLSQNPAKALAEFETASEETLETTTNKRRARQGFVVHGRGPDGHHFRKYYPNPGSTSSAERRARLRRDKRSPPSTQWGWERTLNMLATAVPQFRGVEGEEIWLSKQTLIALSGTSGSNSWVHHVRGGCQVEVTKTQSSLGNSRQVYLRGSPRAVSLTREYFTSFEKDEERYQVRQRGRGGTLVAEENAPNPKYSALDASPLPSLKLPVRVVLTADKGHIQPRNWMRADKIPPPTTYNVRSFKEYVEDLTYIEAPRLVKRDLYGIQLDSHNVVVANILLDLFTDPNTSRFASAVAVNLAFAFLCHHTELSVQTNILYEQCRNLRLSLQPQTYNYVLRVLLLLDHMTTFRQVLDDQLSEGHTPNANIWLAFLKSRSSLMQKRCIADWMYRKGLLGTSSAKGEVVAEIVNAELKVAALSAANADRLIGSIDARFGRDWMSTSFLNRVLLACTEENAWMFATKLFDESQRRSVTPDSNTMQIIFILMQRRGSLRDSLDLLRSHYLATTGRNDLRLIPIIFMTAWKSRFYNVCRVLWRYGAVRGIITYRMQNVVTATLLRNQGVSKPSALESGCAEQTQEWNRRAGKILVGTDIEIEGSQQLFSLIDAQSVSASSNPMMWLAQYTSDGEQRDQQMSLAYLMVHRDLNAWKHFAPPSSERLFKLLSQAYSMDVQWKKAGIGLERGGKSTEWMIENAIQVPLVKKEISLNGGALRHQKQAIENGNWQSPFPGKDFADTS